MTGVRQFCNRSEHIAGTYREGQREASTTLVFYQTFRERPMFGLVTGSVVLL